jgi:hypothetical protein
MDEMKVKASMGICIFFLVSMMGDMRNAYKMHTAPPSNKY